MRIAVLGTGVVGRTLADRLAGLGHDVVMGTRDVDTTLGRSEAGGPGAASFAAWHADHPTVRLLIFAAAAGHAEIVFNATSGMGALGALRSAGEANLAGKVLIDVTNPLDFSGGMPPVLNPVNTDSLGEQIQRAFPEARVVKALNTMNCQVMTDPARLPGEHNVFVCGNDAGAKAAVTEILASFGWPWEAVIDLGDISASRGTEMVLPLWLRLMQAFGHADFNFAIQRAG
jgi:8-hydroxy-5-deazaflavin:NADPH oxidoreductase